MSLKTHSATSSIGLKRDHFTNPKPDHVIQVALEILKNHECTLSADRSIEVVACHGPVPEQLNEETHVNDMPPRNFQDWSKARSSKISTLQENSKEDLLIELIEEIKDEKTIKLFQENSSPLFNFFKSEIKTLQKNFSNSQLDSYYTQLGVINHTILENVKKIPLPCSKNAIDPIKKWEELLKTNHDRMAVKNNIRTLFNEILNSTSLDKDLRNSLLRKTIDLLLEHLFGAQSPWKDSASIWIATITNALPQKNYIDRPTRASVPWKSIIFPRNTVQNALLQAFKRIQALHCILYPDAKKFDLQLDSDLIPAIDLNRICSRETWEILIKSLQEFKHVHPQLLFFYSQFAWFILDQYLNYQEADLQLCLAFNESLFLKEHCFGPAPMFFEAAENQYAVYYRKISRKLKLDQYQKNKHKLLLRKIELKDLLIENEPLPFIEVLQKCNATGHIPLMDWAFEQINQYSGNQDETIQSLKLPDLLKIQSGDSDFSSLLYTVSNCLHQFSCLCDLLIQDKNSTESQKLNLIKAFEIAAWLWTKDGFKVKNFTNLHVVFNSLALMIKTGPTSLTKRVAPILEHFCEECITANKQSLKNPLDKTRKSYLNLSLLLLEFKESQNDFKPRTFHLWASMRHFYKRTLTILKNDQDEEDLSLLLVEAIGTSCSHLTLFENNKVLFKELLEKEGTFMTLQLNQKLWAKYAAIIEKHNEGILKHDPVDILKWI